MKMMMMMVMVSNCSGEMVLTVTINRMGLMMMMMMLILNDDDHILMITKSKLLIRSNDKHDGR